MKRSSSGHSLAFHEEMVRFHSRCLSAFQIGTPEFDKLISDESVRTEVKKFLILKAVNRDISRHPKLVPSYIIDDCWMAFMSCPVEYVNFCDCVLEEDMRDERIIDHIDLCDERNHKEGIQKTIEEYHKYFGSDHFRRDIWSAQKEQIKVNSNKQSRQYYDTRCYKSPERINTAVNPNVTHSGSTGGGKRVNSNYSHNTKSNTKASTGTNKLSSASKEVTFSPHFETSPDHFSELKKTREKLLSTVESINSENIDSGVKKQKMNESDESDDTIVQSRTRSNSITEREIKSQHSSSKQIVENLQDMMDNNNNIDILPDYLKCPTCTLNVGINGHNNRANHRGQHKQCCG